jgi:hypothetical protein
MRRSQIADRWSLVAGWLIVPVCVVRAAAAQPDLETLREQEVAQMGEVTPNVSVTCGEFGTPTFIRSTTAFLTRRREADAMVIAADFVNDNPALFGVPFPGAAGYRVLRNYVTTSLGVRHITLQQRHEGQDVFGSLLTANVITDGMLVNIGSSFLPVGSGVTGAPTCGARDAIAAACQEVEDDRLEDLLALVPEAADCTTDWKAGQSLGVGSAVGGMFVQSVLYPVSATGIVQAWDVRLPYREDDGGTQWQCLIAHADGELLMSRNLVTHFHRPDPPEPATFKVFPGDSPVPGTPGLTAPVSSGDSECDMRWQNEQTACPNDLGDGRVLMEAGPNQYSPDGWINDGQFGHCAAFNGGAVVQTCGNNAWVRVASATDPVMGTDVPQRTFAPVLDWADAQSQRTAAAVHSFYVVNEWHDRMMSLGFDEIAGNFQRVNSTIGGVTQGHGGDALEIIITGAIGYGSNGSYTDGRIEDGRAYTITFSLEGTDGRPSAMDRTVLYHELTHAMSMRLHGNFFYAAGPESSGLGEGWGDYFAVALTHEPADDPAAPYPVFSWPARRGSAPFNHYYFGARMYPLSVDTAVNPMTFGYIDTGNRLPSTHPDYEPPLYSFPLALPRNPVIGDPLRNEQHFVGTVWATMLLECRAELAEETGADDANGVLLQLVIDGMKLDPGAPQFVDARDAIMQADILRHGGVHIPALWRGFTQRGLGWNATSTRGQNVNELIVHRVTEDFDPPDAAVSFFYPNDVPLTINTCGWTDIDTLAVSPLGVISSVVAQADPNPCVLGLPAELGTSTPGFYRLSLPPAPCKDSWTIWFEASAEGTGSGPLEASSPFSVTAGVAEIAFEDDMDGPLAGDWVVSPLTGPGVWELAEPVGSTVTPGRDATPGTGLKCWVTQNKAIPLPSVLADDVDPGTDVVLETPPISLPAETTGIIEFRHWYVARNPAITANQPSDDDEECTVTVVQGLTEAIVATYRPPGAASRWQRRRVPAPTSLGTGPIVVRFTYSDVPVDTLLEGGIDDVTVYSIASCGNCCDGDYNRDGNQDGDDVAYLTAVVGGGDNPTCVDPDFNRDGNVDQDDIAALVNYNAGAGCP